jgi:hypothetical protein
MGEWVITITDSSDVVHDVTNYVQRGASFENAINQRPVMRCSLVVRDGDGYRPRVRDIVAAEDDLTRVFGGIIWEVKERPVVNYLHRRYDLQVVGFEALADRTLFNGIVPPPPATEWSLKDMLQDVVLNLSAHGLGVDGGMAEGPTLTPMGFNFLTVTQCIQQLALASGWNYTFGHYGQVRMDDPGTNGAPFALVDTNSSILKLEHTTSLANYVNGVWVRFGDSSQRTVIDSWLGNGSDLVFPSHYMAAGHPGTVIENGVTFPVGVHGVNVGMRWYYRASDRSFVAEGTPPANGHVITSEYAAQFPGAYIAQDNAAVTEFGPWTIVVDQPDVFEWTHARYIAQGELERRQGVVRRIKVTTMTPGLEPGMTVNVTASKLGITAVNFLVLEVRAKHLLTGQKAVSTGPDRQIFEYEIEAVEGNQYQQNWQEYFKGLRRSMSGGGGSTTSGVVPSTPTSVAVSKPFWGGSREGGQFAFPAWKDFISWVPVQIDGGDGSYTPPQITVRVFQKTFNASTSVQVRVVRSDTLAQKGIGAATTSTDWVQQLISFTPDTGLRDYHLQILGGNGNNDVFGIGTTL